MLFDCPPSRPPHLVVDLVDFFKIFLRYGSLDTERKMVQKPFIFQIEKKQTVFV